MRPTSSRRSTPAAIESFRPSRGPRGPIACATAAGSSRRSSSPEDCPLVAIRWRVVGGPVPTTLSVRPFLSGRDYHALHHANPAFRFEHVAAGRTAVGWTPYEGVPGSRRPAQWRVPGRARVVPALPLCRGARPRPRFRGGSGRARACLRWDLGEGDAVLHPARRGRAAAADTAAETFAQSEPDGAGPPAPARLAARARGRRVPRAAGVGQDDRRRLSVVHRLGPRHVHRAARALPRHRAAGRGAVDPAGSGPALVSEGMLPNRFADQGDAPEFNSVDASLWYVVAVHDYLQAAEGAGGTLCPRPTARAARTPCAAILAGYMRGTRYGIRLDRGRAARRGRAGRAAHLDGRQGGRLGGDAAHRQAGGDPGALAQRAPDRRGVHARVPADSSSGACGRSRARFWNADGGCLYDVVDVDHRARHGRSVAPAQPDARRRRAALSRARWRRRAARGGRRGGAALDAARPPDAGAGRPAVRAALRGRRALARRRLPPGHRVALAARAVRRGVGPGARETRRGPARGPPPLLRPAAGAPRRGRAGTHLRDRRRRAAAHAARLSLPGLVGGRGAAARSEVLAAPAVDAQRAESRTACRGR